MTQLMVIFFIFSLIAHVLSGRIITPSSDRLQKTGQSGDGKFFALSIRCQYHFFIASHAERKHP